MFADLYRSTLVFFQQWGITESQVLAYSSTLLISIAPFLLLFLFRVENKPQHRNKLRLALSFACGGLLGDAFLHLIPHSMGHGHHEDHEHEDPHHHHHEDPHHHHHHEHGHEHHHDHSSQTFVGLYIVTGVVLFFVIEKLVHILKGESHSHSHFDKSKEKVSDSESYDEDPDDKKNLTKRNKKFRKHVKKNSTVNKVSQTKLVSGILNLIADFLHNFTDGLAIGATFAAGKGMGTITAITILLHEIPHEIGDYAILIQAGYKRSSALGLQLVTAIGALIGTAVGLHYGTLEDATQFILPITAGGFVYIATVSIMPSLQERATSLLHSVGEMLALFTGIGMMYWIAMNE